MSEVNWTAIKSFLLPGVDALWITRGKVDRLELKVDLDDEGEECLVVVCPDGRRVLACTAKEVNDKTYTKLVGPRLVFAQDLASKRPVFEIWTNQPKIVCDDCGLAHA